MDDRPATLDQRLDIGLGFQRDRRPDRRVRRISRDAIDAVPWIEPSIQDRSPHLANQTPFFAQKKSSPVCEATVIEVPLLIVSCAAGLSEGLLVTLG